MKHVLRIILLAMLPLLGHAEPEPAKQRPIKVAFAISEQVTVMDLAGPWEVFADTSLKDAQGKDISPYELYTVSASTKPLHSEGANHPGLTITPDYSFADAPTPDIVVVPAQAGGPELQAWLKTNHARQITIMSVCTGAFQLGHAGLLDGKHATTHHWYFGDFAHAFPDVTLEKQVRYVQADPVTFTAGGLTSGIDLALHMVADRFGQKTAEQTANFMEYLGTGWKSNRGVAPMDLPVTRQDWTGQLSDGTQVVLHKIVYGASPTANLDIPSQKVEGALVTAIKHDGNGVRLSVAIDGHPVTISGSLDADGRVLTGTLTQDGKSYPLILHASTPIETKS